MNKQDALQKLAALEAETKALRAIIEAPEVPAIPKRWRPRRGDSYSQVLPNGEARDFMVLSNKEYAHGNCFKTAAQAEFAAKAVGQTFRICAAAFTVDPGAGGYDYPVRRWSVFKDTTYKWQQCEYAMFPPREKPIYVHSHEQAEQMAAILNAEGN